MTMQFNIVARMKRPPGRPRKEGVRKRVQMIISPELAAFIDAIGPDELGRLIAWARPRYALLPVTSDDAAPTEGATVLRPTKPVTVEVVSLWSAGEGQGLRARLREKNDVFRAVVRDAGFEWNEREFCWARTLNVLEGPAPHRLAELAAELLRAGFIVSVGSATVADLVVRGNWIPATKRWILPLKSGDLLLRWEKGGDTVWEATRHLKGARWDTALQGTVISAARYADIRDFAEQFAFTPTAEAEALLQAAAEAERRQLLVLDVPEPLQPKRRPRTKRAEEVTVPDDLLADHD